VLWRRLWLYAGLIFVTFTWGINTVAVKHAVASFDPLAFTGLRFIAMTPLAFALAKINGERVVVRLKDLPLFIACGACGYGVYQYFWILGLAHTTAFASSLLAALSPVITLAIVAVSARERVRSGRWAGAAIALLGVAIFEGAFAGRATFRLGDGLTLISAGIFALFNVFSAKLLDRYTPLSLVAISMTIGTLIILPGAAVTMLRVNYGTLPPLDWAIWSYAVVFPIVLTYPIWSYAISRLGAGRTSLFQFAVPVITGFLSVPLLHNRFEPHQIIGAAVCIAGMAISQLLGVYSLAQIWTQRTLPLKR